MLAIAFGGIYLSTPAEAFCPNCRTCTGGCTGCFSADCDDNDDPCGIIQDSSGNYITCEKASNI